MVCQGDRPWQGESHARIRRLEVGAMIPLHVQHYYERGTFCGLPGECTINRDDVTCPLCLALIASEENKNRVAAENRAAPCGTYRGVDLIAEYRKMAKLPVFEGRLPRRLPPVQIR